MDPLSEVLSLLKLKTYVAGGFDGGNEWSIQFGRSDGVKCYALVSGHLWLAVEGVAEPVRLETGDCLLLPRGLPFRLATNLALPAVDAHTLLASPPAIGETRILNGGGQVFMVGGYFAFAGTYGRLLLQELPPIVHIRADAEKAELRWALERMRQELREQRPGAALVAQQLATMMLVQALRLHLAEGLTGKAGWLRALADGQMKAAISAMHDHPAHDWTLQELAERSGMSRSIFALKFKTTVGTSPIEYLTRWRMLLAADKLTDSDEPVAAIARAFGYESESAFSKAFRRTMGRSPRQYRGGREVDSAWDGKGESERSPAVEATAAS